jgi:hypothetical protein
MRNFILCIVEGDMGGKRESSGRKDTTSKTLVCLGGL